MPSSRLAHAAVSAMRLLVMGAWVRRCWLGVRLRCYMPGAIDHELQVRAYGMDCSQELQLKGLQVKGLWVGLWFRGWAVV